ncbi:MAG TPA: cellulase family glycosylhydrolase [Bacteroidales bacterium]|nr:cellulase family glycosylhydrolase [Bacteroidales bacterium]
MKYDIKLPWLFLAFCLLIFTSYSSVAQLTPKEALPLMQKGINLGNTLEPPDEAGWNNPKAEEYYFDMYKEAGFQCVRIPVRWDNHTQTVSPYKIDAAWMNRVEQVVDWGLNRGLFIVINAHHEEWIKANYTNASYRARFDSIWSQIAVRFKDKSDHLFFEIINEPNGLTKAQNDELHQRELSIIRKTNPTRIVIFQGHNWGGSDELIQAAIPYDPYIMGSFHSYDPYLFGLEGQGTWGSAADYNNLKNKFIAVSNWSTANKVQVFLGEFGSLKSCDYNSRMLHYRAYVELSQTYGFVYCAWDDGGDFRIMEREQHKWDEVKDILLHTTYYAPAGLKLKTYQDTILQLNWSNRVSDNDSIYLERRTASTAYKRIASLKGDTTEFLDEGLVQGENYYYRVIAHYNDTTDVFSQPVKIFLPVYIPKVRSFYLGEPLKIPGVVEAEDFDVGGEGLTYHEADDRNIGGAYRTNEAVDIYDRLGDGFSIGNALPGEWYEYTVDVQQTGEYIGKAFLSTPNAGGRSIIQIGDAKPDTITALNSYSWLVNEPVSFNLSLEAGEQVMRYSILSGPQFNIDKFEFELAGDTSATGIYDLYSKGLLIASLPGNGLFIRMINRQKIDNVKIYSSTGRLVESVNNSGDSYIISYNKIQGGIYIIRVVSDNKIYTRKISCP